MSTVHFPQSKKWSWEKSRTGGWDRGMEVLVLGRTGWQTHKAGKEVEFGGFEVCRPAAEEVGSSEPHKTWGDIKGSRSRLRRSSRRWQRVGSLQRSPPKGAKGFCGFSEKLEKTNHVRLKISSEMIAAGGGKVAQKTRARVGVLLVLFPTASTEGSGWRAGCCALQGRRAAAMFSSCAGAFAVGFDLHL